jgi:hypothetical protein
MGENNSDGAITNNLNIVACVNADKVSLLRSSLLIA